MQTHLHITISFTFYLTQEQLGTHLLLSLLRQKKGREGVEGVEAFFNSLSPPLIAELVLGTNGFPPPCSRTCKQPGLTMVFLHGYMEQRISPVVGYNRVWGHVKNKFETGNFSKKNMGSL